MPEIIRSASFFIGKGDGKDIISFGSGQPDLDPPKQIYRAFQEFRGKKFSYGLIQGNQNLRELLSREYPRAKADDFVITNGASEALDLALRAIAKPRAKVLLPIPYYYSYPHNVRLAGMVPAYYHLRNGVIDLDELASRIQSAHAILINSPSNPGGSVQRVEILKVIEALAAKYGTYVISDNVYKDLIYDDATFYSIQGERACAIDSFSKTFALCGVRVGYIYSKNKTIIHGSIEAKTHTSMNTNTLAQAMAYEALRSPKSLIEKNRVIWKSRRDFIYDRLTQLGLDVIKPQGAFYVFPKFKSPTRVINDLFYKYRMITYDGTWFGDPSRVRFSYALDIKKIEKGMERLSTFLTKEYKKY